MNAVQVEAARINTLLILPSTTATIIIDFFPAAASHACSSMGWGHDSYTVTLKIYQVPLSTTILRGYICTITKEESASMLPGTWYKILRLILLRLLNNNLVNVQATYDIRLRISTSIGQVEAACRQQQQQ